MITTKIKQTKKISFMVFFLFFSIANLNAQFQEQQTKIIGLNKSSIAWGDYNNDGLLDLLIAGSYFDTERKIEIFITKVYINKQNGIFAPEHSFIEGAVLGDVKWIDYNHDGYLDISLCGNSRNGKITEIYRNINGQKFVKTAISLQGISEGEMAWADYDNDGDDDLLISGIVSDYPNLKAQTILYRNELRDSFTVVNTPFEHLAKSSADWADYDNDGDLDLLLCGFSFEYQNEYSIVYKNTGNGRFVEHLVNLFGVSDGKANWVDFDSDGDVDIVLSGSPDNPKILFYENIGDKFQQLNIDLPGIFSSTHAIADYDNDGNIDFFFSGLHSSDFHDPHSFIVRNKGDKNFEIIQEKIPVLWMGKAEWGDADDDGDLDLAFIGFNNTEQTKLWLNLTNTKNKPPSEPKKLTAKISEDSTEVTFKWHTSKDKQTDKDAITYNLHFASTPNNFNKITAKVLKSQIPKTGNVGTNTEWTIKNLQLGVPYHWSVQAVDGAYAGSPFAIGESFIFGFDVDFDNSPVSICEGDTLWLKDNSKYVRTYRWQRDGIIFDSRKNSFYVFKNPGNYTISLVASNGTFSEKIDKQVEVLPTPDMNIYVEKPQSECRIEKVELRAVYNAQNKYLWTRNDTVLDEASNRLIARTGGNYLLTITNNFGCSNTTDTIPVDIRLLPDSAIFADTSTILCHEDTVKLTAIYDANLKYKWFKNNEIIKGDTSSFLEVAKTGNYKVEITNWMGCTIMSNTIPVIVNPNPEVEIYAIRPIEICKNDSSLFIAYAESDSLNYQWFHNDMQIKNANDTFLTAHKAGIYQLLVKNKHNCSLKTNTIELNIKELPIVKLENNKEIEICIGDSVEVSTDKKRFQKYEWYYNNKIIKPANKDFIFASKSGIYYAKVYNKDNCYNFSDTVEIQTIKVPDVEIDVNGELAFCEGGNVALEVEADKNYQYTWYRNNKELKGEKQNRLLVANDGDYFVEIKNKGKCSSTSKEAEIILYKIPKVTVKIQENTFICNKKPVILEVDALNTLQYHWFYNNQEVQDSCKMTFTATQAGKYQCKVVSNEGCEETSEVIEIKKADLDFSLQNTCPKTNIPLQNKSTIPTGEMKFEWNFGDGTNSKDKSPQKQYENSGIYNVTLTVDFDGFCLDTLTKKVAIYSQPVVDFDYQNACFGQNTIFHNRSSIQNDAIVEYNWNFGDGIKQKVLAKELTHAYKLKNKYHVTLTAKSSKNCINSFTKTINVEEPTPVSIFAEGIPYICGKDSVVLKTLAKNIQSYQWFFNLDSIEDSNRERIKIRQKGDYHCTIIDKNNCINSSKIFKVDSAIVNFEAQSDCAGNRINFKNRSSSPEYNVHYYWEFGDFDNSTSSNPSNIYTEGGDYEVKLKANFNDNCIDSIVKTIPIYIKPKIDFAFRRIPPNLDYEFSYSTLIGINEIKNYSWDFGDGTKKEYTKPDKILHTYAAPGSYPIKISVVTHKGCKTEIARTIIIE